MTPQRYRRWLRRAGALLLFGLVWYVVTSLGLVSTLFFPSPQRVLETGVQLWEAGELQRHIVDSLMRVVQGFTIGSVAGVIVGIAMAQSRTIRTLLRPSVEMFRPVPALALVPLIIIWFGIGETGKILLIAYGVFFIVMTSAFDGVRSIDDQLLRAATGLGANQRQMFARVMLPGALPEILTGLSLAMGTAFSVLVAAELVAATSGLGWMIQDARRFFRTDVVLLGMVAIGLLGFLFVQLLQVFKKLVLPWDVASLAVLDAQAGATGKKPRSKR